MLEEARQSAYRAVNFAMVLAYWEIGNKIVEHEQHGRLRATYGESLLKQLSKRLTADFGKGFSLASLKNYRQFYFAFPQNQKGSALRGQLIMDRKNSSALGTQKEEDSNDHSFFALRPELSWKHYRLLMRVESQAARDFYMKETIAENWSSRALERQINSLYYERIISSKNKKETIEEARKNTQALAVSPADFIKDPFVLEFLDLPADKGF